PDPRKSPVRQARRWSRGINESIYSAGRLFMMETRSKVAPHSAITVPVVRKLLHRGARSRLARILTKAYPLEVARLLSALRGSERALAFDILVEESEPSHIAHVVSEMSPAESVRLL